MSIETVTSTPIAGQSASLGMKDFLKILLAQLTTQDPLKPVDNQQFMAQIAQFTALEQSRQANDRLSLLVSNQASLQSLGLLGRVIEFTATDGPVTGTVTALSLAGEAPQLTVTTSAGEVRTAVGLGQIASVR